MDLRKIDALIAKHVFNRTCEFASQLEGEEQLLYTPRRLKGVPRYSSDISAAWELTELGEYGFKISTNFNGEALVSCHRYVGKGAFQVAEATANTAPLAMCLAALKVNEIDVDV